MTTSSIQQKIACYGKKQGKTQSVQTENINDKMVELYPHIHTHAHKDIKENMNINKRANGKEPNGLSKDEYIISKI